VWKVWRLDSVFAAFELKFHMTHISGSARSQLLLLPDAVDDYVSPENPVRFIDAFVDELDLEQAGFIRVQPKSTGRPGYSPADLLKLYIYGVSQSRSIEPAPGGRVPPQYRGHLAGSDLEA
jgi:hypothetical protein